MPDSKTRAPENHSVPRKCPIPRSLTKLVTELDPANLHGRNLISLLLNEYPSIQGRLSPQNHPVTYGRRPHADQRIADGIMKAGSCMVAKS
jgi:hypothetical protein